MEENEIIYIPYGLDEISLLDLMTSLADGVESYLGSKRWAKKDKYRLAWLNAYLDIINRGITGASNDSGIWKINHKGDNFTLDTMSNTEREMYQDAAYYIQLKMALMPLRKKEEEKKKENLEKFGSFKDNLMKRILNGRYGGEGNLALFLDPEQGWDAQDVRGADGLRGTKNRKAAMIAELKAYKKDLDNQDLNYNFEGTAFKDKADLQTKIQAAIDALGTNEETDDLPAFSALGLPYRAFFNNGGNDPYTKGSYTGTYAGYNEYLAEQNKAKQKAEQEKLKLQRANQWKSFRSWDFSKLAGRPLTSEESNSTYLDNLFAKGKWTADELSQIVSAFKLAELNNQLVGLSKEELAKLPSTWKNRGKYLKRINGLNTPFYYDTLSKQFKLFNNNDLNTKISFLDVLDLNNPELLEQKRLELQNSKKLKDEDWDIITADTVSMLGDLVSLGGGYAGAAGGLTTILSDLYADLKRGKNFSDVATNLAKNTAWGFAGLIPGVKLAKLGKRAAQLYALYNSWGIITDPDVHKSWQKLIKGEDFTSHDFENLKWTLHAVTGAHNTVRSHLSDKALNNKLNSNKVIVETKNGKRTITAEQQKEINKAGGRGGQEAANKKFLEYAKAEAKEGSFEFNSEGRKWYNPTRYSQKLRNATSNETKLNGTPTGASKMTIGRMLVLDRNKPIIANPLSSSTYKNWWTSGGPNRGYTTMALGKTYLNTKQNNDISESSTSKLETKLNKTTEWSLEKIDKYLKNLELMESSFLNRDKYNPNSKTLKKIDLSKDIAPEKYSLADGKELEISLNNGTLNIKGPDGIKISLRISDLLHMKKVVSDVIKNYNNSIGRSSASIKRFSKEYIESLKELRRKGYLFKQGGTINNPHIDNVIEDFIKNNNI